MFIDKSPMGDQTTTIHVLQADLKLIMCLWLLNYFLWNSLVFNFPFFNELKFYSKMTNIKKKKVFRYMTNE